MLIPYATYGWQIYFSRSVDFFHCFVYFAVQEFSLRDSLISIFNEYLHQGIFRELSVDLSAELWRVLAPPLENPY